MSSVNLDGKDKRDHLQGAKATQFRLSPNGRWVAFTENFKTYIAPFFSNGKTITLTAGTRDFSVRQISARSGEFLFSAWEALRGATIDGAASLGMDHAIGSIETGKLADIMVIDGNRWKTFPGRKTSAIPSSMDVCMKPSA